MVYIILLVVVGFLVRSAFVGRGKGEKVVPEQRSEEEVTEELVTIVLPIIRQDGGS